MYATAHDFKLALGTVTQVLIITRQACYQLSELLLLAYFPFQIFLLNSIEYRTIFCGDINVEISLNALVLIAFIQVLGRFSLHLLLSFGNGDNFTSSF